MFRNTFQSGFLSILFSLGSKPLQLWDKKVRNGHIKRIIDDDIRSLVLELIGSNISSTYISCPLDATKTLGIKLPLLVLIVKNLGRYFTFEVQILDDKGIKRRFRASNFQSTTRVKPYICTMPLRLDSDWNQVQFNMADFTKRAYGTNFVEALRVQIHANCRIRRIFFCDRVYAEDELPAEFKLYLPVTQPVEDTEKIVDSMRRTHENPTEWKVRKAFLMKNFEKLPKDRLECLSNCFVNVELYGAAYMDEVMIKVKDLGDCIMNELFS
ncbi:Cilia- and flagella-associated protein 20 [Cichlidogyrus casuarinus]|uniref:Cilia- and flagella-associated protein 20 n=1 Tax=Cichlidogyrus casuarinus TaxID=1844966 RepID=A0ABD2Q660_9PLAT